MARLVKKTAYGPKEVKPQKESVWICMCGLSKNQPFCDKSHLKTVGEDNEKVYAYDEKGERQEVCGECDGACECSCTCGCDDCKECSDKK